MHFVAGSERKPKRHQSLLATWPEDRTHCCRGCGGYARIEPDGERRWGCMFCDEITFNPDANFTTQQVSAA